MQRTTDESTLEWKPLGERDYFAKLEVKTWRWWRNEQSLLSDSIIDLDYNMSMSKVKDTVDLVLMHQMKSVQWVEYYLLLHITTIAENTWPWPLTLTVLLDLDLYVWHWGWSIATLFFEDNKINVWRHVTQKRYFVRYIGDNNPDRYFLKEHDAPN